MCRNVKRSNVVVVVEEEICRVHGDLSGVVMMFSTSVNLKMYTTRSQSRNDFEFKHSCAS